MELKNKELCGKNIYFVKRSNRFSMYFNDKKVGEIELNNEGNVIALKAYNKKYVKNLIYYISQKLFLNKISLIKKGDMLENAALLIILND